MGTYKIKFKRSVTKAFVKLCPKLRDAILVKMAIIAQNPYAPNNNVKKMSGVQGRYRFRQGDYRVVYDVMDRVLVLEVVEIDHRKEVYR